MFNARIPYPRDTPIDWLSAMRMDGSLIRDVAIPALKHLSTIDAATMPDLMTVLPPPESPTFPEQAFGLLLLLDQAPRSLLDGVNERWQVSFFDPLALTLAKQFEALPENLRPDSKARWIDELRYDFDHWILVKLWFVAVLVHSESTADQDIAMARAEVMRKEVEAKSGKTDPYRSQMEADAKDTKAFPKRAMAGPPKELGTGMEDFMLWILNLLWVHGPIIRAFGRYPYRNGAAGRENTKGENVYMEEIGHFAEMDAETAGRILSLPPMYRLTCSKWSAYSLTCVARNVP
jgi:uncharacterized protein (DUF924 family)